MRPYRCILLLSLTACDPGGYDYDKGTVPITARVINPKPIIHLGDSVAFYFEVPDTVLYRNTRTRVAATGKSDGATIGFHVEKINSSAIAGFDINSKNCQIYANPGSITAYNALIFDNRNGKLLIKLYMIPKKKGIFFFDQTEEGYMDLNNAGIKLRFSINFGNVARSQQMLIDSAGVANHFDQFLLGKQNSGFEVYGFRVI